MTRKNVMVIQTPIIETIPITLDEDGIARVDGTRVTMRNIIAGFNRHETPEEIASAFPDVRLGAIYAVITWYLNHQEAVDVYLAEQPARDETVRQEVLARSSEQYDGQRDALGWPIGFFERTYGSFADNPVERDDTLPPPDVRDPVE